MKKTLSLFAAAVLSLAFASPAIAAVNGTFGVDSFNPETSSNPTGADSGGTVNGPVTNTAPVNGPSTPGGTVKGPGTAGGVVNGPSSSGLPTLPNPLGDKVGTIPQLIYKIVQALVDVSYVVIAFFLILSGFKFVMAQGSEDKLSAAKNTFFNTIIGAVIIIGAQVIVSVAQSIFASLK